MIRDTYGVEAVVEQVDDIGIIRTLRVVERDIRIDSLKGRAIHR